MPTVGADVIPRVASEQAAAALAARGVRVSVVRLPPSVHGEGDHGFVPLLIGFAREKACLRVRRRWHGTAGRPCTAWMRRRLYRLALEKAAAGAHYHGVADEGVPFRTLRV